MKTSHLLVLTLGLSLRAATGEALPSDITQCMRALGPGFAIDTYATPPYFRGRYFGGTKSGYAVAVQRNRLRGIMFCSGQRSPVVLGAGAAFHNMRNLNFTSWRIHPSSVPVERGVEEGIPPRLLGDALLLEWESASAIVYWSGRRFEWYQQGD